MKTSLCWIPENKKKHVCLHTSSDISTKKHLKNISNYLLMLDFRMMNDLHISSICLVSSVGSYFLLSKLYFLLFLSLGSKLFRAHTHTHTLDFCSHCIKAAITFRMFSLIMGALVLHRHHSHNPREEHPPGCFC